MSDEKTNDPDAAESVDLPPEKVNAAATRKRTATAEKVAAEGAAGTGEADAEAGEPHAADSDAADSDAADSDAAGADAADADAAGADAAAEDAVPPQYGVGPFSIREVALSGVWLVAFVVSFFPQMTTIGRVQLYTSVWLTGIDWVLAIGVPTVAMFLLILRRLSPSGIRRVGSLGIDQFASVAFTVAAVWWVQELWGMLEFSFGGRNVAPTWVAWVEPVMMVAAVVMTVFAPIIPVLGQDFRHRPPAPAHRNARAIRPVSPRPARVRPPAPAADHADAEPPATTAVPTATEANPLAALVGQSAKAEESVAQEQAPSPQQAFWALVPEDRTVVDATGAPLFTIGPTAWALVIEDRGDEFVVRHEDGRTGYLHDVSGVTRG